ncbi:PIN domain-containing protein [Nocardia higoensis]|uniref:PIN domain-containing protein n=1 Tax=Nocardia higoensis TaxID=228599 RepID=UPI000303F469|nr:PIN domain-containing protein [Nocardia higoensis]
MSSRQVQRVLVDANIFYSRTLRDWLCLLYLHGGSGMFQLYWTEDIMAEVLYRLRRKHPFLDEQQVGGIRRAIIDTIGDHGQILGYTIDRHRHYPDPLDAHIHCAALHGEMDIVLTANGKDFTSDDSDDLPYEVYDADAFFELIDDSNPALVRTVTQEQLVYWVGRKGKSLPEALRAADAGQFAERVRRHLQTLDVGQILAATDRSPTAT